MKKIKTLEEFVAQVQSEKILAELKQLKKIEVKQFDKVLALYKSLRPRYYFAVKKAILNMKVADSTKEKMSHFNELILESCYTDFNFLEEAEGFAIGDKVYNSLDSQSNQKTITEIFEKDGNVFVWFLENAEVLDSPILIELISKTKQEEKVQSLVDMVKSEERLNRFFEYHGYHINSWIILVGIWFRRLRPSPSLSTGTRLELRAETEFH